MSELKVTGLIKLINEVQTFDSGFSKREFVVTTKEQYQQDIKIEVVKDKCALLDSISQGDEVSVSFNIRGNEYNSKYYVTLQGWKIEKLVGNKPAVTPQANEEDDDLPF